MIFQAVASVKEKDRELEQERHVVQVLRQDCDQALATLKQHGLMVDTTIEVGNSNQSNSSNLFYGSSLIPLNPYVTG